MPKVLVTGASGLLGRAVLKVLKTRGMETLGLAFTRVGEGLIKCDLKDSKAVVALFEKEKPDIIIHAAAERSPDKVEADFEGTKKLNIDVSKHLATIAKARGCLLIYISTDYVFDGTNPPHKVTEQPKPLNKYGQTKLEGEIAVLQTCPSAIVLRVPVLYGSVERLDESAVTCLLPLLKAMEQPKPVNHYEKRYPSHVNDIAKILADLIDAVKQDNSNNGIFQWSGQEQMTKYDMVVAMAEALSLDHSHLKPDSNPSPGATRPYNSHMDTSRLEWLGISHHTLFREGIKDCLQSWM